MLTMMTNATLMITMTMSVLINSGGDGDGDDAHDDDGERGAETCRSVVAAALANAGAAGVTSVAWPLGGAEHDPFHRATQPTSAGRCCSAWNTPHGKLKEPRMSGC